MYQLRRPNSARRLEGRPASRLIVGDISTLAATVRARDRLLGMTPHCLSHAAYRPGGVYSAARAPQTVSLDRSRNKPMYSYTNPSERMTKRLDSGDPTLKHLNNIDGFMITPSTEGTIA
jgi:hypothetical protein